MNGRVLVGSVMVEESVSADVQTIAGNQVVALNASPKCWCGFSSLMSHTDKRDDHQFHGLTNCLSNSVWVPPEEDPERDLNVP